MGTSEAVSASQCFHQLTVGHKDIIAATVNWRSVLFFVFLLMLLFISYAEREKEAFNTVVLTPNFWMIVLCFFTYCSSNDPQRCENQCVDFQAVSWMSWLWHKSISLPDFLENLSSGSWPERENCPKKTMRLILHFENAAHTCATLWIVLTHCRTQWRMEYVNILTFL